MIRPDCPPPPPITPAQLAAAINAERARHRWQVAALVLLLALALAACAPTAPRVGDQGGNTERGAPRVTVGPDGPAVSFWDGRRY